MDDDNVFGLYLVSGPVVSSPYRQVDQPLRKTVHTSEILDILTTMLIPLQQVIPFKNALVVSLYQINFYLKF